MRAIKARIAGRRAFIEVTVGPGLSRVLDLDENTSVFPLVARGNRDTITVATEFMKQLGTPVDQAFVDEAMRQGRPFFALTASVYLGLTDEDFAAALEGELQALLRNRSLVGAYMGGDPQPVVRIDRPAGEVPANVHFLPPTYRGIPRFDDDPINPELLKSIIKDHSDDRQLQYNISVLTQIYGLQDRQLAIARYFSLLETMAGPLESQFMKAPNAPPSVTRGAIRYMLGYFDTVHIPRFTHDGINYEFDHVEFGGRLRHRIFHGSGRISQQDLTKELYLALPLLERRPDMIAYALRRDCEREIAAWVKGESRARRALAGEAFLMPARDPAYNGDALPRMLITSNGNRSSGIGSVWASSSSPSGLRGVAVTFDALA